MSNKHIALITYLVHDYDEAIAWFSKALGFVLFEDASLGEGKRWVVIGPNHEFGARFLLAKAATPDQIAHVGLAAGGRVAYFLHTDDFSRDHGRMLSSGVTFMEQPRREAYGTVAVFVDLYGNKWDLLQPAI